MGEEEGVELAWMSVVWLWLGWERKRGCVLCLNRLERCLGFLMKRGGACVSRACIRCRFTLQRRGVASESLRHLNQACLMALNQAIHLNWCDESTRRACMQKLSFPGHACQRACILGPLGIDTANQIAVSGHSRIAQIPSRMLNRTAAVSF